mmetsp:Transcript_5865/g.12759  ORF Transcript_5865/g.12759 Transcript_5865/m.12759 type:complete len:272 (+) Transcript_5865:155-970(+)
MSSLRRTDLLALSHLRNDGRKPHEIRKMSIQIGPLTSCGAASGSAIVQMGLTVALATVRGPAECTRRSDELPDRAVLDVTVRSAPFAPSGDRRPANPSTDRRLVEQSNLVKKAMEATILLHLYPRSRISIDIVILADDGGRLCAGINAATLALVDAAVPLRDMVCACSAGLAAGAGADGADVELVDLNGIEARSFGGEAAVHLPCATMPQRGTVVLAQCEARVALPTFERLLAAAMEGCAAVFDIMQASVRERGAALLAARNGNAAIESGF